MKVDMEKRY